MVIRCILVALLALAGLVVADPVPWSAEEVARLIGQLGSDDFDTREAASTRLEAIGEPALEALRRARDESGDAEVRRRARDLSDAEPVVQDLEARLHALNAIDPAHGEPVQGQRYLVGQEFKAHTDYFEPDGVDFHKFCSVAGQPV